MAKPYIKAGKYLSKKPTSIFVIFKHLRLIILGLWIISILYGVASIGFEQGFEHAMIETGEKILNPTLEIKTVSEEIINEGGIYIKGASFFESIWEMLKNYGSIIFALTDLYIWVFIIHIFSTWILSGDRSRVLSNWLITITIFYLLEVITLTITTDKGINSFAIPYEAIKSFVIAIPYMIPFIDKLDINKK